MQIESDEGLMNMVQTGDLEKSAILFERYHIQVYNYFLRMTFNKQHSMDLSQSTFYRMLRYRESFNNQHNFKSWLFGIARNIFIDNVKSKHSNTQPLDNLINYQAAEEDNIIKGFENEALYYALESLKIEDRELIEMSRFNNLKYNEISEILGITVPAIKVKMHRAIKKLREAYFAI